MLPIDVSELWPLSRELLMQILEDRCSDQFVCERIWERLGYVPAAEHGWLGPLPPGVGGSFPQAPQVIAERPASVRLTRSIAKEHKQLLKQQLQFAGYRIGELYPRRTRRATAVSWLLAWLAERSEALRNRALGAGVAGAKGPCERASRRSCGGLSAAEAQD